MARVKGVDELLEFLIEKVALCGPAGANEAKIKGWTSDFYNSPQNGPASTSSPEPQDTPPPMNIDHSLVNSILGWLDSNPHTYVVWPQAQGVPKNSANRSTIANLQTSTTSGSLEPTTETNQSLGGENQSPVRAIEENSTAKPVTQHGSANDNIFVYASKNRQWRAIAGHGEDSSRLREKEFQILSLIAAHGENGIMQPDLIKLSGQDKRSLPARTDFLHRHGYIDKETVIEVGKKTSLCTLQRFVKVVTQGSAGDEKEPNNYFSRIFHRQNNLFRPLRFVDVAVEFLKRVKIIKGEEFSKAMGVEVKSKQNTPIRRYLQHMAKLGCIELLDSDKKLQSPNSKLPAEYLKYLREPSKKARESFGTFANPKSDNDAEGTEVNVDEHINNDGPEKLGDGLTDDDTDEEITHKPKGSSSDIESQLQWDPDRPIQNQVATFVGTSGAAGVSSANISARLVGPFWRAPREHLFGHLTDHWQESQPLHLRHLAIIRDTAQSGKSAHYVYRTYNNFSMAVQNGDANWEAVIDPRIAVQQRDHISDEGQLNVSNFPTLEQTYGRKRARRPSKYPVKTYPKVAKRRADKRANLSKKDEIDTENRVSKRARLDSKESIVEESPLTSTCTLAPEESFVATSPEPQKDNTALERRGQKRRTSTDRDTEIAAKRTKREKLAPGVHINPPGRFREQQGRKGRRPKFKLAVIRSESLSHFDWFDKTTLDFSDPVYDKPVDYQVHPSQQRDHLPEALEERLATAQDASAQAITIHQEDTLLKGDRLQQGIALPQADDLHKQRTTAPKVIEPRKSNAQAGAATPVPMESSELEDHGVPSAETADSPTLELSPYGATETPMRGLGGMAASAKTLQIEPEPIWKRAGVQLGKGSRDYKRWQIILNIVKQAGGVFPGHKEMWYPFVTKMRKTDPDYKPDVHTVNRVVRNIVSSGKLKRQTFGFKDRKGISRTRDVLFLPDIPPDSEKLRELQAQMAEKYPLLHLPGNIDIDSELMPGNAAVPNQENPDTGKKYVSKKKVQNLNAEGYAKGVPAWQTWAQLNSDSGQGPFNLHGKPPQKDRDYFDSDEDDTAIVPNEQLEQQSEWQLSNYTPRTYKMPLRRPGTHISKRISLQPLRPVVDLKRTRLSKQQLSGFKPDRLMGRISANSTEERDLRRQLMSPTQQFYATNGTFSTCFHPGKVSRPLLKIQPDLAREFDNRMPHSIDDIINQPLVGKGSRRKAADTRIEAEIDRVQDWEFQNSTQLSTMQLDEIRWINHSFSSEEASRMQWLDAPPPLIISHVPGYRSIFPSLGNVGPPKISRASPLEVGSLHQRPTMRAPAMPLVSTSSGKSSNNPLRDTNSNDKHDGLPEDCQSRIEPQEQEQPTARITRGPKLVNLYSKAQIRRLIIAVTVARTLTGGIEKAIDWHIVKKMCPYIGNRDNHYLKVKWTQTKRIYRSRIDKLEVDFQKAYLKAYEEGIVPPIDFNDVESYDWNALAEWVDNDMKVTKVTTKQQIVTDEEDNDSYEKGNVYQFPYEELYKTTTTSLRRMELLKDLSISLPLRSSKRSAQDRDRNDLAAVKSYLVANAITPESTYNSTAAAAKLKFYGEKLVGEALDELKKTNVLRHTNKGRPVPGRNFVLTDQFYKPFRAASKPLSTMFQSAARYKELLDEHFDIYGQLDHSYHATNGEMLAIYNLFAHHRVSVEILLPPYTIDPAIVPTISNDTQLTLPDEDRILSIWGFTHGNYKTMTMDKENVIFPLRISPTAEYVKGQAALNWMPPPPITPRARENSCLWTDINNQIVPGKWTMVLSSVLNLLAFRPGMTVGLLTENLDNTMKEEDVALVLKWLEMAGLVQEGQRIPLEWFWAVFGSGNANDESPAQDDVWQEE